MRFCHRVALALMFSFLWLESAFPQSNGLEDYTISALKIENNSVKLNGILDEPEWQRAEVITELIQCEPTFGIPLSEKTTIRILYDDENIFLGAVCYYQDIKDLVASKLAHRDIGYEDQIAFVLDTFRDRTKAYCFMTNAYGAKDEGFIDGVNEYNAEWNEVWQVKTKINQNNWTAEFKIPLRTLRFPDLQNQTWGFNIYRSLRKKNERGYWTPIPPQHQVTNLSLAGRLIGLKDLKMKRNLQLRPYVLYGSTEDMSQDVTERKSEIGLDLKYVPRPNLAVDLTYNTDFAQIESDEEQINLTRFSLYYPEKRDFFLENARLFEFGMAQKIQPFFSRRIGIHEGSPVSILFGAKLTGKLGRTNLGFLNITTEKTTFLSLTNYTALRVRQDILKNSNLGFILTNVQSGEGYNRCWGIDSEIWLTKNSRIKGFYSAIDSNEVNSQRSASHLSYNLNKDLVQFTLGYVNVEKNYDPASGFVIIKNIKDYSGLLRKSFRPNKYGIRKIDFTGIFDYTYTQENQEFMRQNILEMKTEFESGDMMSVIFNNVFEKLYEDFEIPHTEVSIPVGEYTYNNAGLEFIFDEKRKFSGRFSYVQGGFFDGRKGSIVVEGLSKWSRHLLIGGGLEYNDIHLQGRGFTTTIGRLRVNLIFNSNLSLRTYFQYNSLTKKVTSNLRLHLLHGNDNDFYIVFNNVSHAELNRLRKEMNTLAIKINYRVYL